jgi:hypothetical protein
MAFVVDNYQLVSLADGESLAADYESEPHDVRTFDIVCVQAIWTGANSLTINSARVWVEGSLDNLNWCNVFPETSVKQIKEVNGCLMYTYDAVGWIYQRVRLEHRGCNTGTIKILSFAKRRRANNP